MTIDRSCRKRVPHAVLLLALLVSSCGDAILGPPDDAVCTRGTLTPGRTVAGEVTMESCRHLSAYTGREVRAESWELALAENAAYFVRLRHVADEGGNDTWRGNLTAYARNAQNDPVLATAWRYGFGPANPFGSQHQEMLLVSDRAQRVSVRAESGGPTDGGAYTLEVVRCPLHLLNVGEDRTGIDLTRGCPAEAYDDRQPTRVTFLGIHVVHLLGASNRITATRNAGDATFLTRVGGPGLDQAEVLDRSILVFGPYDQTETTLAFTASLPGMYAMAVGIPTTGTAMITGRHSLAGFAPTAPLHGAVYP